MSNINRDKLPWFARQENRPWVRYRLLLLGLGVAILFIASLLFLMMASLTVPSMTQNHSEAKTIVTFVMDALVQEDEDSLSQLFPDTITAKNLMNEWKRIRKAKGNIKEYSVAEVRLYPEIVIGVPSNSTGVISVAIVDVEVNFERGKVFLEVEMRETKSRYKIERFRIK